MINFEIPENESSIIKVIGVGGGGGNAVDHMHAQGIDGVDFILCNTDAQALSRSSISHKIQLGPNLTQGLGAGAKPEIGKQAGEESVEEIRKILEDNTKMVFITAGMGGGTGTGAAPVIAQVCKELDILTVGIVTTPFFYEGNKRLKQAKEGINAMKEYVDTILIISNDKLREQFGSISFSQAFSKADSVLSTAVRCITDLISVDGRVNLDFNDVQTVMKNGGRAILGSAQANGEDRAITAVQEALDSPLLNDNDIKGAKWILLNITSGEGEENEHTLDELEIIQQYVQEKAGNNCDIILGMGNDASLNDKIAITVIATGFNHEEFKIQKENKKESTKIVVELDDKDAESKISNAGKIIEEDNKEDSGYNVDNSLDESLQPVMNIGSERHQEPQKQERFNPVRTQPIVFSLELTEKENRRTENKSFEENVNIEDTEMSLKHRTKEKTQNAFYSAAEKTQETLQELEREEKEKLEDAKRHLELRAEKIRQRAFGKYSNEEDFIENVPAFERQKLNFEPKPTEDELLSGYEVESKKSKGAISTINSFLKGKRPD